MKTLEERVKELEEELNNIISDYLHVIPALEKRIKAIGKGFEKVEEFRRDTVKVVKFIHKQLKKIKKKMK